MLIDFIMSGEIMKHPENILYEVSKLMFMNIVCYSIVRHAKQS